MSQPSLVITIDGPAGSGKSTAARNLAERLGYQFLDTGAMYRAVAWKCLHNNIPLTNEQQVGEIGESIHITFRNSRVLADGEDVSEAIRTAAATEGSSIVAGNPRVRAGMGHLQRQAAAGLSIVTEGRDQGTEVFPDAFCKFFLTASLETRAGRRFRELHERGVAVELSEIEQQLRDRDARDEQRTIAPLRPADDAIQLDTSKLNSGEVLDLLERYVREKLASKAAGSREAGNHGQ